MYVLPYGQMSLWGDLNINSLPLAVAADKQFMGKLIGLIDGDGYIEIGPQKQYKRIYKDSFSKLNVELPKATIRARLVIRLHHRDHNMLLFLTKTLGVGSISTLETRNQTRLIFSKKDLVTVILPLIKKYNFYL